MRCMLARMLSFAIQICQSDPRADYGVRLVALDEGRAIVERIFAGILMRLSIPFRQFTGVLLASDHDGIIRLSLLHRDPDLCLTLSESDEDFDMLPQFTETARRLALPRYIEPEPGERICLDICVGVVMLGRMPVIRRRGANAIRRRPRFLVRRRMGEWRLMKPVSPMPDPK
jgi:hypothetical protein